MEQQKSLTWFASFLAITMLVTAAPAPAAAGSYCNPVDAVGAPHLSPYAPVTAIADLLGSINSAECAELLAPEFAYYKANGYKAGVYYSYLRSQDEICGTDAYELFPELATEAARAYVLTVDGPAPDTSYSIYRTAYQDYLLSAAKRAVDAGADWIVVDDAYTAPQNFDPELRESFKTFLAEQYTVTELTYMGIADLSTFDYADYVLDALGYRTGYNTNGRSYDSPQHY